MSFQRYICWKKDDANHILRTEALEGSRALFMATHVPIEGFEVSGHRAVWVERPSDKGLQEALLQPGLRHALCVVEGEPGSGKSHLIRWLRFNWPKNGRDEVVLVPRSEGSLEGTLRGLRAGLPADLQGLFAGLGEVKTTSLEGRALDFQSKLAHSFTRGYFTSSPPLHADWAESHQISQLLDPHQIRGEWKAPRRILNILSGMKGERNSRTAEFTLEDVLEFTALLRKVQEFGIKATRFKRRLTQEADELRNRLEQGAREEDLLRELDENSELKRLVEALNARLNHAVQDLLGISSQALKNAFMKLREELARPERNKRLVLLFEDITSMQGVQDQLMDVMIASSETEENRTLCDLITIVGVTPGFFHKLFNAANLRQRISLHLKFGQQEQSFQEIYALRSSEERLRFVSRYLKAVRSGLEEIEQIKPEDSAAVPNRCNVCPHRTVCHATFGSFDEVGLYPFTETAISQLYARLRDIKGEATLKTPRGMIQGVLVPTMLKPQALLQGEFPPPDVESVWVPKGELTGIVARIVSAQGGDEQTQERLRRIIAWWGDRDSGKTQARKDGMLEFASVPQGVFEAFSLPWLGSNSNAIQAPEPPPVPPPVPQPGPPPPPPDITPPVQGTRADEPKPPAPVKSGPPKEPKPVKPKRVQDSSELQKRKDQLTIWFKSEVLEDATFWKRQLFGLMKNLPWRALGISSWAQHQLFSEETLLLEGTAKGDMRHLVLPREPWVREGLEAFIVLNAKGEAADKADVEFQRRRFARLLRKLSSAAQEYVSRRIPATESGETWSPARSAAQVLLVRSWLRGTIAPDAPAHEQWNAVVDNTPEPPDSSQPRVEKWGEVVQRVKNAQSTIYDPLLHLLNLPQDPLKQDLSFYDAGEVAAALLDLIRTLRFAPLPKADEKFTQATSALEKVSQYAHYVEDRLQTLARFERERLLYRAVEVDRACRYSVLPEYLQKVENTASRLVQVDPSKVPQAPLAACHKALAELRKRGLTEDRDGTAARRVDDFLRELTPECREQLEKASLPEALVWALRAPAADLATAFEQIKLIEGALKDLHTYVKNRLEITGAQPGATLHVVQLTVKRMAVAIKSIQAALPKEM